MVQGQTIKNGRTYSGSQGLSAVQKKRIEWIMIAVMTICFALAGMAQDGDPLRELNYEAQSEFKPIIKDAIKFRGLPEITDTVRRIKNVQYGIRSFPLFPEYKVRPIESAKLQNEPLDKLYHSLLKVGYSPLYNMPLAEFSIANTRSRNQSYGARLKHFSSSGHLRDVSYSGFSDNEARVFGKRFYRRHTLSGEMGFSSKALHYYGFDTSVHKETDRGLTRQRYQLIDPSVRLQSHYSDSSRINHTIGLGFYNLKNLDQESENNIRLNALGEMFINREKLNIDVLADFYNHKQAHDTINNMIVTVNPSFEARGEKWVANMGVAGTIDHFRDKTRFYFYPTINMHYDIYQNMVIPYAGVSGGLIKNSMRSLSGENPFVDSTLNYRNTNNRYNLYGGLRGNITSNISYDAQVRYSRYDSLHFFAIGYNDLNSRNNRYSIMYDNTNILNVNGQISYQTGSRLNITVRGNYYLYNTDSLVRAYHRPEFDMTFSAVYNIKSKIILRADLFLFGKQWAPRPVIKDSVITLQPEMIKGWADMNLEAEYRYSKMLSFFARFNNIANQRYYRWDRYPVQKFNFILGLTFVPF